MSNSQSPANESVSILGYDDDADDDLDRGLFDRHLVRQVVDLSALEAEMQRFLNAMDQILGKLSQQVGNYSMETITVSAEVNAKGKVSLLGSGGEMGGKGGLSFTFKRTQP